MRQAKVFYKQEEAGVIKQLDNGRFIFTYNDDWYTSTNKPAISLTLPKTQQEHHSKYLFPFFYNMLPEGTNKQNICFELRIDAEDYFGLLLAVAKNDTVGAVQIKSIS